MCISKLLQQKERKSHLHHLDDWICGAIPECRSQTREAVDASVPSKSLIKPTTYYARRSTTSVSRQLDTVGLYGLSISNHTWVSTRHLMPLDILSAIHDLLIIMAELSVQLYSAVLQPMAGGWRAQIQFSGPI